MSVFSEDEFTEYCINGCGEGVSNMDVDEYRKRIIRDGSKLFTK
jgi:hypothetical protein